MRMVVDTGCRMGGGDEGHTTGGGGRERLSSVGRQRRTILGEGIDDMLPRDLA